MTIKEIIEEAKEQFQKVSSPFLMPKWQKEDISRSILSQLDIEKENNRLLQLDENRNNLLHLLFQLPQPDIEAVQMILECEPRLLEEENKFRQKPYDILWSNEVNHHCSNRLLKALLCQYMEHGQARNILDQEANISLLERFAATESNQGLHYDYITSDRFDTLLKRPTLLCFPGRYAYEGKEANGLAKFMRKTLSIDTIETPKIQTISAWYPGNTLDLGCDLYAFMSPYLKYEKDNPFTYVNRFVKRYLRPLYTDEDGYKLPVLQAAKNMRMINLFGYSYGASIVQMISNELSNDMHSCGYSKKEMQLIQSQISVLTIGYFGNVNNYKNFFSAHHLLHFQDRASYDTLSAAISKKGFSEHAFYISTLKHQPNQRVFITNGLDYDYSEDPHNIKTYFNTERSDERNLLMNLWKECILINALNNSVINSQQSDFEMLPLKLNYIPERIEYLPKEKSEEILENIQKKAVLVKTPKSRWLTRSRHKRQFCANDLQKTRI